ncbi:hypothetical protein BS47DRAFT_1338257 [Hydnum rufescens UP504]|uniref:Uncharacterized protein n=1 Tax=Hydnum rufescens UP504 TaxID=1448309 RepID=A0A9P6B7A5_9AGAM|nr:hypothetical protein BS47DRAFT_1338257 [Hydnum rufescens UP504]
MYIRRLDPLFANSEGTLRSFESIRVPSSTEGFNSISTRFLIPGHCIHFSSSSIILPIASTPQTSNTALADAPLTPSGWTI